MVVGWLEGSWGGLVGGRVGGWRLMGWAVVVLVVGGFIGWVHILTHP